VVFKVDDLKKPSLLSERYNLIACIEGIEHIEKKYQQKAIEAFYNALKPNGVLIISTPEAIKRSGKNKDNPYHLHELTRVDFEKLLWDIFSDVQIVCKKEKLHTGILTNCLYGVCHK
jgi:2-polyprenyl-3-methyl-5-hydroxy-6-metoxy-1,4-benzoquinol methylase